MRETAFAQEGLLLSFTTVWVPREGLGTPYMLSQVKLEDGPVVVAHVRGLPLKATLPVRVRLCVAMDEHAMPPFWFEPEEEDA